MAADILARGLAAKSWAGVRARSVTIEEFGATGLGDDRAAVQRAIDFAAANGVARVTTRLPRLELWEPLRTLPLGAALEQFYADRTLRIPACDALDLDFAGAEVTLKGPTGGARFPGQVVADGVWLGGFITVTGPVGNLRLANVDVEGGFTGDTLNQDDVNLFDKGFLCQDLGDNALGAGLGMGRIEMENVVLHGFAGEIMYDNSAREHISRDCHFYNSGHSCWNPSGVGRLTAYNLQAGIARQPAEVVCGVGHTYHGGRFYQAGTAGCLFIGGPDPGFGNPYNLPIRRTDAPPPFTRFIGTRFEHLQNYLYLGSYMRGSIELIDAELFLAAGFASADGLHDIDLEVTAWADRRSAYNAVTLAGPATDNGHQPRNINLRVHCGRTRLAAENSRSVGAGLEVFNLVEADTISCVVDGIAGTPFRASPVGMAGFAMPRIEVTGFTALALPMSGEFLSFSSDQVYAIGSRAVTLFPQANGTFTFTLATAGYQHGQRFRFIHDGSGGGARIVRFAKDGGGLKLNAERTLRGAGEYLELEYSAYGAVWVERAFCGQAPTGEAQEPTLIDSTTGVAAFSAAPWSVNAMTLASAGVPGPDGTGDATRLTAGGGGFNLVHASTTADAGDTALVFQHALYSN
ncbi:MAG: hypothetical protein LC648_07495 [Novosphingobium sp.]|nr:hypothetical protein [Novosphingobium sp.]